MKRTTLSIVIALTALLVIAGGVLAASMNFAAHMRAGDIVNLPAGYDSQGKPQGQATFKLSADGLSMDYKINVANLDHITAAHIHRPQTTPGANGPVIVWLYPSTSPGGGSPTGRINGTLIEGTFDASNIQGGFTWAYLLDLLASGDAYVNVHTSEAPGGEVNGHIH
jgi:hypothetical protein